jgi:hypothetical protein
LVVFHARDIATDQTRALFDVALGEILFFAECAKAVSNNHGGIISPGRLEDKLSLSLLLALTAAETLRGAHTRFS